MSLRKEINRQCRNCVDGDPSLKGTWKQRVDACRSDDCRLHPMRTTFHGDDTPLNEFLDEQAHEELRETRVRVDITISGKKFPR